MYFKYLRQIKFTQSSTKMSEKSSNTVFCENTDKPGINNKSKLFPRKNAPNGMLFSFDRMNEERRLF